MRKYSALTRDALEAIGHGLLAVLITSLDSSVPLLIPRRAHSGSSSVVLLTVIFFLSLRLYGLNFRFLICVMSAHPYFPSGPASFPARFQRAPLIQMKWPSLRIRRTLVTGAFQAATVNQIT